LPDTVKYNTNATSNISSPPSSNMAPLDDTTPETRFDSFSVYRTSYKKIRDHEIEVGILVPNDLKPGKSPLIVKFHGGGLVSLMYAPVLLILMANR
jgi:cephalosporin-C deacetylase-like acetyl esterase